jgi:hypothetical protein
LINSAGLHGPDADPGSVALAPGTGCGPLRGTPVYTILRLLRRSSPRFRSRLVRAAGLYWQYTAFLDRIMQDSDARVRANLIEALWKIDSRPARVILRAALPDAHHRVRTNALLGLFFLGDPSAADTLIEQAGSSCPEERMAAAWAMGQTKHDGFRSTLTMLATADCVEAVRERARTSMSRLSET